MKSPSKKKLRKARKRWAGFDASAVPAKRIGKARKAYNTLIRGRQMATGVSEDGSFVDPFDKQGNFGVGDKDGTYALNPWLDAYNRNPWRGNQQIKNYKGETETVRSWQADRAFSANLGMTGFNDINERLAALQEGFSATLEGISERGFDALDRFSQSTPSGDYEGGEEGDINRYRRRR